MVASMNALAKEPAKAALIDAEPATSIVVVGVAAFALVQLGLAVLMVAGPHSFYSDIGPFGSYNGHYIRDVASFYGALGIGLAVALRHVSWRVPVLALATMQYGLHSLNHLLDIGRAHPAWTGYFDFVSLLAATALLGWLWRAAARESA